jgi:molybdopterin adenylyltransferase
MKVLVVTVSDRASQGIYEDRSGPEIEKIFKQHFSDSSISRIVIPDSIETVEKTFRSNQSTDVIITTGGTGIGPKDKTPDITEKYCDYLIPGIAEYLRRESCKQTVNAVISRGTAGIKDKTIIINLPGSVKGAKFCAELLVFIIPHAIKMLTGEGH